MIMTILVLAAAVFLIYAVYTQYSKTPTDASGAKRVWLSVVAAAAVIGAAISAWFTGGGTTP